MRRACVGAAVALLLAGAAEARASTVTGRVVEYQTGRGGPDRVFEVRLTAAAGEANVVRAEHLPTATTGGEWHVTDTGAPLQAGGGCAAAEGGVVCAAPRDGGFSNFAAQLNDGNDRGEVASGLGFLYGGEGDDELIGGTADGGPGNDTLTGPGLEGGDGNDALTVAGPSGGVANGGPGDDRLTGSPADDRLDGGGGVDTILGEGGDDNVWDHDAGDVPQVDRDRLDGGRGRDLVRWSGHPVALRVDLAAVGGQAEGDDVTGFEDVEGGDQDDVLIGDDGPNKLDGGFGSDVVEGAGGADVLFGGFGGDRLDGGAGADFLSAGDEVDRVTGGAGADRLRTQGDYRADRVTCDADDRGIADRGDRGLRRCERVKRRRVAALVESSDHRGPRARLEVACEAVVLDCAGTMRIRARAGGRWVRLGRHPFSDKALVRVTLPRTVRDELRRRGRVRLALVSRLRGPGRSRSASATLCGLSLNPPIPAARRHRGSDSAHGADASTDDP